MLNTLGTRELRGFGENIDNQINGQQEAKPRNLRLLIIALSLYHHTYNNYVWMEPLKTPDLTNFPL